jgi:hypothetical protein
MKISKYIGPIIWWPIILIFPFRTYYHLERINWEILVLLLVYALIGGFLLFLLEKLSGWLINKYE